MLDSAERDSLFERRRQIGSLRAAHDYTHFIRGVLGINCVYNNEPAVEEYLSLVGAEIDDWLEHRWDTLPDGSLKQKVPRKILINPPRKTFKTSGLSEVAPVFASCRDPNIVCGIMSASYQDLAVPIAENIRRHYSGAARDSKLTAFFGDFHASDSKNKWSGTDFTIDQRTDARRDPTVSTYGVRMGVVGHHFDLFIIDDPVSNEAMRNNADWLDIVWKSWVDLSAALNPNSLVIVIMTRYHNADLAGRIIANEIIPHVKEQNGGTLPEDWSLSDPERLYHYGKQAGWTVIYRQSVTDPDSETPQYNFPGIWSPERVTEVRRGRRNTSDPESDEYSELFFQCQLQNTPHLRRDNPVKEHHISIARGFPEPWSREEAPRTGYVDFHCDFAFKSAEAYLRQSGDLSALHVKTERDGTVWRINGWRGKVPQDEFGNRLIDMAYWALDEFNARIRYLSYDRITGQGSGDMSTAKWILGLFRRHPRLNTPNLVEIRRTKRKEEFILDTVWAWQDGLVRLCKEAPYNDQLIDQMLNIGYSPTDDDADAFAAAFHPDIYRGAARVTAGAVVKDDDYWKPAVHEADHDESEEGFSLTEEMW